MAAAKKVTKKAPKEDKAEKKASPIPRETPEGHVGLKELAEELGSTPAALRRRLRASELTKPEGHGWYWKEGSKDLAKVKKFLTPAEE